MSKTQKTKPRLELDLTDTKRTLPAHTPDLQPLKQLDWFSKLDKGSQKICSTLADLADRASTAMLEAISAYTELVLYIKEQQIHPDLVKSVLAARGFNDARISEIKKVVAAPPEIIDQLKQKVIGFKRALQKARELDTKKDKTARFKFRLNKATTAITKLAEEKGDLDYQEGPWHITVKRVEGANQPF